MTIYRLTWTQIDWNAFYTAGYNYVINNGIIYATTKEKALANCPIKANEGKIEIEEIAVI